MATLKYKDPILGWQTLAIDGGVTDVQIIPAAYGESPSARITAGVLYITWPADLQLDSTLSSATAAAPADKVGELKSDLTATKAMLAPAYSTSATYAVGDHVTYNGGYYVCNTTISTAEAWTAAHWTQVTVGGENADLKSATDDMNLLSFSAIESHKGFLNSNGTWSNISNSYMHKVIKVNPGDEFRFRATSTNGVTYLGFLKSYTEPISGATIPYSDADGYGGKITTSGGYELLNIVPNDTHYIVVQISTASATITVNTLKINGMDILDTADNRMEELYQATDEIIPLKNGLDAFINGSNEVQIPVGSIQSGYVVYTTGDMITSDNYGHVGFINIEGYSKLKYSRVATDSSADYYGIAFYSGGRWTESFISGKNALKNQAALGYVLEEIDVPSGAKYVALSAFLDTTTYGNPQLYGVVENAVLDDIADLQSAIGTVPSGETVQGQIDSLKTSKADIIYANASGAVASFDDGADDMPLKSCVVQINPVQASGTPSPSNPLPISGWTEINGAISNNKLFTVSSDTVQQGGLSSANGGATSSDYRIRTTAIKVKPSTTYSIRANPNYVYVYEYATNESTSYIGNSGAWNRMPYSYTTSSTTEYIRLLFATATGATTTKIKPEELIYCDVLENGVSVPIHIDWQDAAGTVYGGNLDVRTGVLTVTHHYYQLTGEESWTAHATQGVYYYAPSAPQMKSGRHRYDPSALCNAFEKTVQTNAATMENNRVMFGAGNQYIYFRHDDSEDVDAWETFVRNNTITITYPRLTAITYQLTPVEIRTLLSNPNNLWADTGDIAVSYTADTKLYVDQKISAAQQLMELIVTANRENSMTATKPYASGNLLIVNGTLYKATTSIANGAKLTVGTNVTATTVAAEIAALA